MSEQIADPPAQHTADWTPGPMERWVRDHLTPTLGGGIPHHEFFAPLDEQMAFARSQDARLADLERQNAELVAALEIAVSTIEQLIPEPSARGVADVVLAQARAALARAKAAHARETQDYGATRCARCSRSGLLLMGDLCGDCADDLRDTENERRGP